MFPSSVFGGIIFFLGLAFGSFANAVVYRLKTGASLWDRSACTHCRKPILARDLIPVFSWMWLRGRCRFCQKKIAAQYPVIELLMGGLFVTAYARHPFLFEGRQLIPFFVEAGITWSLTVIAAYDLRWQLIPMKILWGTMGFVFVWRWAFLPASLGPSLLGMVFGGGWMLLLFLVSRGKWIGSGDIWLAMLVGLCLGWPHIVFGLYLTYVVAGLVAAILLMSRRRRIGERLAFAPFLGLGVVGSWWFWPLIAPWFQSFVS